MATPKSLVLSLYLQVIEHLVRLSCDITAFEESHILSMIGRHHPESHADDMGAILRLVDA